MTTLLALAPRQAGVDTIVEPEVTFASVERSPYGFDRCPITCACIGTDCRFTYNSYN